MSRVTPKRSPRFGIVSLLRSTPRSRRTRAGLRRLLSRDEPEPTNTTDDRRVESKQDWFEQVVALVKSNPSLEHKILKDPSGSLKWLEITSTKCFIDPQLGPVSAMRLVVSTTKTYKVDVLFPVPRTVERLKGMREYN